ncbi:MAG: tRNA preQ1(34) S-adenosylmethionine ribosyltransferase-isomerase QueA, partial [Planctomycetia bacterium]|nr:tRNA preQ1(34) S-adenosylmethionine ribosyltransferase-isomerase QueA [Planctomycetia bacterium]
GQQLDVMDGRDRCRATILLEEDKGDGVWHVRPTGPVDAFELLKSVGKVPLPPYIRREQAERQETTQDRRRYQTVYAKRDGAVAAPTAGLHFTRRLFERLEKAGVETSFIMLHVGLGTFQPVRAAYVRDHRMHAEYYELSAETVRKIRAARKSGGRIVAVGTTTVRALESAAAKGRLEPRAEWTDIFIHPPFRFRVVDALITNFHLPRSTLLMLVSAFAGRGRILEAYEEAKRLAYRFYSYGDAMLIL